MRGLSAVDSAIDSAIDSAVDSASSPPVALYVHVPFCLSLCPYCDFVVYAGSAARGPRNRIADFLTAVHAELDLRADAADEAFPKPRPPLGSVYLGGGTPSLLPAPAVAALLEHVHGRFGIAGHAEISLEANPGPSDRGDLSGFRAAGVTRISLGVQSLDAAELRALGRRHTQQDVTDSVGEARTAGFEDISLDLLYDLPGQTQASWRSTLAAAIELEPEHLSTYALTLELEGLPSSDHLPAANGSLRWRRQAAAAQDEDRAADLEALADELLEPAGYVGYEIANRARPGHESRHNLAYWLGLPYEALGPGAHAFDGDRRRRWNAGDLGGYLAALRPDDASGLARRLPPGEEEILSALAAASERLILALRLASGIEPRLAERAPFGSGLRWGLEAGLLERSGDRLRLTSRGRLLSNELFVRLLPEPGLEPGIRSAA